MDVLKEFEGIEKEPDAKTLQLAPRFDSSDARNRATRTFLPQ